MPHRTTGDNTPRLGRVFDLAETSPTLLDGEYLEVRKHLNIKWHDLRYALAIIRKSGGSSEVRWAFTRWGIERQRVKYLREATRPDPYKVIG